MPFDARMAQRSSPWRLLSIPDAELQQRLATLSTATGLAASAAGDLVLSAPQLLEEAPSVVQRAAEQLRQYLPPDALGQLLTAQPGLLAAGYLRVGRAIEALRLWTQVLPALPSRPNAERAQLPLPGTAISTEPRACHSAVSLLCAGLQGPEGPSSQCGGVQGTARARGRCRVWKGHCSRLTALLAG